MTRSISARDLAVDILERVRSGRFVEHALSERLARDTLKKEERALATELVYGVVRWQRRLDAIIDRCTEASGKKIKPAVRDILRVALYQLILLERIPAHAAVNEAVGQARCRFAPGPAGFVNAVLRNALRNMSAVDPQVTDDPRSLAMHFSHPEWLVNRWVEEYGPEITRRVLLHNNSRAYVDLRVNTLKTTYEGLADILRRAGGIWRSSALVPTGMRVSALQGPVQSIPGYAEGFFAVQDLASQMIAPLLKPQPDHRILDACAAPGGKTAHLAALTQNRAHIVAVDSDEMRVEETRENLQRLGIQGVELGMGNAQDSEFVQSLGLFDRILLDAPCTGLGVLRHNPEAKYRLTEMDLAAFGARQLRLLTTVAQVLKIDGLLVYSVCTVSREETSEVVERFLAAHPHFSLDAIDPAELPLAALVGQRGHFSTFPPPVQEPMDGFFAARIRREG
jgi:16S rRNA (cytosine967-C5)-methyltransferase